MLSMIYAGRELGEKLPVRTKVNGAFYVLRIFRECVASRPDNNRIGLRRRQQQLRSNTACQEETSLPSQTIYQDFFF